jgi:hypothetical protein
MAINCSSNALLDNLNAKKEALNAKVGELSALGAKAMADIAEKADEMKGALLSMMPEIPVIANFKKELDELKGKVGAELAEAKAAFKERWGDALPDVDIDGLMEKVTAAASLVNNFEENLNDLVSGAVSNIAGAASAKFDFCKDVPNIDAPKVSAEGKVEKVVDKGPEPTTPVAGPKKVEVVVPTVIEKEKEPSVSPKVDRSAQDLQRARERRANDLNDYRDAYKDLHRETGFEVARILRQGGGQNDDELRVRDNDASLFKNSRGIVGRENTKAAAKGISLIDWYNAGKIRRKMAAALVKKYLITRSEELKYDEYLGQMMAINHCVAYGAYMPNGLEGEAKEREAAMNKRIVIVKEEGGALVETTPGGHDGVLTGYVTVIEMHKQIMADLQAYKA